MSSLAERLEHVRARMRDAASSADRQPEELHLTVVTKNHPASLVRELVELGVHEMGENRHQEAAAKADALRDVDVRWNFVGQLQTNKAKAVSGYANAVHSVDSHRLLDALGRTGRPLDVFLQVNLTEDAARGGCRPYDLDTLAESALEWESLTLLGVMGVAPLGEEPRAAFSRLRRYSDAVRRVAPHASSISAGMSHDFEAAIFEGATHLRIGTAITGNRRVEG